MSRIHEALKKAEQERAAIVTAETEMAPLQAESATQRRRQQQSQFETPKRLYRAGTS